MLSRLKNLAILCVEDNVGVRKRLVNTLKFYFRRVYEAGDGNEALAKFKELRLNVVMTDIDMPNMDGIELVKKIRDKDKDIPIIILTAYSNEEYLLQLINMKIDHFILKPINAQKLEFAIKEVFGHSSVINLDEALHVELGTLEIVHGDKTTKITNRERLFLELLYKNRANVTTYQNIQDYVWQNDVMSQTALKTFIKVLRKKFPKEVIENISGVGYRFVFYNV
jgi:DNA-binding response OmpR family regulator